MSEGKFPDKLRYEYRCPEGQRPFYAHGVWGGVNPHGEIEMNFYMESDELPGYSERAVLPDGSVGPEMVAGEQGGRDGLTKTVVRDVGGRVVMNYRTAKAVLGWLEEKVAAMELEARHMGMYVDEEGGAPQ